MASEESPGTDGPASTRWSRILERLRYLTRFRYIETADEPGPKVTSRSLDDAVAVGLPGVAMADQPSIEKPVVQADLTPPGPSPDQVDSGGAQPSTADEDETVHTNGSFDGSPGLSQNTFGT